MKRKKGAVPAMVIIAIIAVIALVLYVLIVTGVPEIIWGLIEKAFNVRKYG